MDLNTVWFILVGVLLTGYAILDGFDLGVGVLHLFVKGDHDRRVLLNAIGPVWDGNEVWLVTGGGALFAAFPAVYASVFSGFYLPLMLLLVALIFRAVSIEFRSKVESARWRGVWDVAFGIGSLLPAVLLGVAFGNILRGIPINEFGNYTGTFIGLLNPFALLVGLLTLLLFTMHGALYLQMKTEGPLRAQVTRWIKPLWSGAVFLFILATAGAVTRLPFLFEGKTGNPLFWILVIALGAGVAGIPLMMKHGRAGRAFAASCTFIASMFGLSALCLFPRLVPSSLNPSYSLTIANASSSPATLLTMFFIALVGMPLVIGYTIFIYRSFKGKVVITGDSY